MRPKRGGRAGKHAEWAPSEAPLCLRTGSCVSWPLALMEPRTRPRIRSRKAIAAGRQTAGSMDDAKRMAQRWGFASSATARCGPRPETGARVALAEEEFRQLGAWEQAATDWL